MSPDENIIFPDDTGFKGSVLDAYLATGFYRLQYFMFTTHLTQIDFEADPLPVFWLRTRVKDIAAYKMISSIRNRCKSFSFTYKKADITNETEILYGLYRQYIDFNASEYCSSYLENIHLDNPFDSWMIEIRDGELLVAVGYFDRGKEAIAGILNFYHPAYKKCSLGKYLMLLKIDFALQNGIDFYYTGYISPAISKFDYKIFPDAVAMDVYMPREKVWVDYLSVGKAGLEDYVSG